MLVLGGGFLVNDVHRHGDDRALDRLLVAFVVQIHKHAPLAHGGAGVGGVGIAVHKAAVIAGYVHQRAVGDHAGVHRHGTIGKAASAGALGGRRGGVRRAALAFVDLAHALGRHAVHDLGSLKGRYRRLFAVHLDEFADGFCQRFAGDDLGRCPYAVRPDLTVGHAVAAVHALAQRQAVFRLAVQQTGSDFFHRGGDSFLHRVLDIFHTLQNDVFALGQNFVRRGGDDIVLIVGNAQPGQDFGGGFAGGDDLPGFAVRRHLGGVAAQHLQLLAVGGFAPDGDVILCQRLHLDAAQKGRHVVGGCQNTFAAGAGIADGDQMHRAAGVADAQPQHRSAGCQAAPLGQQLCRTAAQMFFCFNG